jgi:hypothetical protein
MFGHVVKVHSSQRIASAHGADIFYEILHVKLEGGQDAVMIQMVRASNPNVALTPQIHVKDLRQVEEDFLIFMDRVRAKTGDSTTFSRTFFTIEPEVEPAVFRDDPSGAAVPADLSGAILNLAPGPKKSSFALGADGEVLAAPTKPGEKPKPKPKHIAAPAPAPAAPAPLRPATPAPAPAAPPRPTYKIVSFTLGEPPTKDGILKELISDTGQLVVVARKELGARIKGYLESVAGGDAIAGGKPDEFHAIVIERPAGRTNLKAKMSGPLVRGIQEILANPNKVLWIPPAEK